MPFPTKDPLTAFLYELMRDHVAPDKVEFIIAQDERVPAGSEWRLTNEELAIQAQEFATRLKR